MHYKNGERAAVGHIVIAEHYSGQAIVGQVVSTVPGATTCNLNVAPLVVLHGPERDAPIVAPSFPGSVYPVTASQALRIDMRPRTLRPEDDYESQVRASLTPA